MAHRWIGLILSIPLLLWTLSALLHPTMRLVRPDIEKTMIAPEPLRLSSNMLVLKDVLAQQGINGFNQVRLVAFEGKSFYRVNVEGFPVRYYNTASGALLPEGDKRYAIYLAQQYLGRSGTAVKKTDYLTEFTDGYGRINRYLPVWSIHFDRDDQLILTIETERGRLASKVDNTQGILQASFAFMHTWNFLETGNIARITIFATLMVLSILMALLGLRLALKYPAHKQSHWLKRYHRKIG